MLRLNCQRNPTRQLCGLLLALVGLVIGIALPMALNTAVSAKQSDSGSISSVSSQELPLSLNRWSSNGPDGAFIRSLAIDPLNPATIYAGTERQGIFKSTDNGGSWSNSLANGAFFALAIDPRTPTTVYAAGGGGVTKSTDGGATWNAINNGLPKNQNGAVNSVITLAINPANPNIIYAAVSLESVFKSTDGGASWSQQTSDRFTSINALAIDPINPNIIYQGNFGEHSLFKSTNSGATWRASDTGLPRGSDASVSVLAINPTNPNIIYAGTVRGVFRSTDGARSWTAFNDGLTNLFVSALAIDPSNPSFVYAGTGSGVFKSTDSGGSWSSVNSGLTNTRIWALVIDPINTGITYAGTFGVGIAKSTSGGASWSAANQGLLHRLSARTLAINPGLAKTIYTHPDDDGFYKSADNGGSWAPSDFYPLAFDLANTDTIYALVSGRTGLSKSTDGGATWSSANTGLDDNFMVLAIDPNNSEVIYAAGNGGIFKSTNGGESWSQSTTGLDGIYTLAIDPTNSNIIYAGGSRVFKSTNAGGSWSAVGNLTGVGLVAIDPGNSQTLYALACVDVSCDGSTAYKSTDGGGNWNAIFGGDSSLVIDPVNPNVIYAGSYGDGVSKSTDGGASWNPLNDGLPNLYINSLGIDRTGNYLHAATPAGVFDYQYTEAPTPTPTSTPTPTPTVTPTATPTPIPIPTPVAGPSWSNTANLNTSRFGHTATLLSNGKVLVAGGAGNNGSLNSAELYDPTTGTWSHTGNLNTTRDSHTATLLPNGTVLVAGGFSCGPPPQICSQLNSAELYDPATGTWSSTGSLNTARDSHTATLVSTFSEELPNAKVLVAGGFLEGGELDSAELYDTDTGIWSNTGNLNTGRYRHTATSLPDGKVLVAGGVNNGDLSLNSAELYDPDTGIWSNTGNLNTARELHTATPLPDGKILIAGGFSDFDLGSVTLSVELYDPDTEIWTITGNLNTGRAYHTATLLPGGKVLVAGGFVDFFSRVTTSAEQYEPPLGTWTNTASLKSGRRFHTATLLPNGKVLVAGGSDGVNALNSAELYVPAPNPIDDARFFVRQQYLDFLSREPEQDGWDYWTARITECGSDQLCIHNRRIAVSDAFFFEPEYQLTAAFVHRIYRASLGVNPTYAQFQPDRAQVVGGADLDQSKTAFALNFVQRSAFLQAYPRSETASQFVDQMLALILQRSAVDLSSLRTNLISLYDGLDNGRAAILRQVADNPALIDAEYNASFVLNEYFSYLRRDPDSGGYQFWLGQVNRFPLRDVEIQHAMVCSFITSIEYQRRFGSLVTRSNADCPQ